MTMRVGGSLKGAIPHSGTADDDGTNITWTVPKTDTGSVIEDFSATGASGALGTPFTLTGNKSTFGGNAIYHIKVTGTLKGPPPCAGSGKWVVTLEDPPGSKPVQQGQGTWTIP